MPIANYSTSIDVAKTYGEIVTLLVRAKAQAVMSEYDAAGMMTHIAFRVATQHGVISFRLPANIEGVLNAMKADKKVPRNNCTLQQAERTAWRILKDWIRAQMAIYEAGISGLDELFLPHAQTHSGETVYERFKAQGTQYLLEGKGAA